MSQCDFCNICKPEHCPKEGKGRPESITHVCLSMSTGRKLAKLCRDKKFMRGEEYYKVPDYDKAVKYLLGRQKK